MRKLIIITAVLMMAVNLANATGLGVTAREQIACPQGTVTSTATSTNYEIDKIGGCGPDTHFKKNQKKNGKLKSVECETIKTCDLNERNCVVGSTSTIKKQIKQKATKSKKSIKGTKKITPSP